jgi:hypothetical protein
VRLHLCWGNSEAPHVRDIPLASIWDIAVQANADAFSFEGANPRHEHEWALFKETKLPEGKILMPGVLDSTTDLFSHAESAMQYGPAQAQIFSRFPISAADQYACQVQGYPDYQCVHIFFTTDHDQVQRWIPVAKHFLDWSGIN